MPAPYTGGCQCGAIRYRVTVEPETTYVCHCRECQKQSASAFGISLIVPKQAFRLKAGAPKQWSRATDSGHQLDCWFCPDCGSRLWHVRSAAPEHLSLKGGTLDEPVDFGTAVHIWTKRKLSGVIIPPGAKQFPGEPD